MTTRERLEKMLEANGLFDTQAKKVMDFAIPKVEEILKTESITWNSDSEGYPEAMYPILYMTIKPIALEWIETNIP